MRFLFDRRTEDQLFFIYNFIMKAVFPYT